jgi:hypothetical protein
MKAAALSFVLWLAVAGTVCAQPTPDTPRSPSCTAEATTKKLAGAAKTSFLKKCEADSSKACDVSASTKKLNGAAKTSFTKKCVTDSVGSE